VIRTTRSSHGGPASARTGATLVEVLMSLMVMAIGIVSVITMFPLAVLRSIQATQLTNAKMLRQNAEESFRMPYQTNATPAVRFDVLNFSNGSTHFRGEWAPNTQYQVDDIVVPTRKKGLPHPVPNRWYVMTAGSGMGPFTSGPIEPNWLTTGNTYDPPGGNAEIEWTPATTIDLGRTISYTAQNYVVDPLGWWELDAGNELPNANMRDEFGYRVISGSPASVSGTRLLRINSGAASLSAAEQLALHPDSWSVEYTDNPVSWTNTSATFRAALDFSTVRQMGTVAFPARVVLTSNQSEQAVIRPIDPTNASSVTGGSGANWVVSWTENLPAAFTPDGPARIERYEPRFSWLATVNKLTDGSTKTTVAVFFKRDFSPGNEHVYSAAFTQASDQVTVMWAATEPPPLFKEGNYLLDGSTAVWYRIVAVSGSSSPVTLTIDRPSPTTQATGRAILMRGIIHLFEL
jgi:Tfp pilus assembly protein PilV